MKNYTKREFVKLLGLGMAISPFISLFSSCNTNTNNTTKPQNTTDNNEEIEPVQDNNNQLPTVTDQDIVLLQRQDELYADYNKNFNGRWQYLPKYIAVCKTSLGVQYAVLLAQQQHLPIAIKSGGHSFEGFSTNDGGMVINVSTMKKMEWINQDTVKIESGCMLQEIHNELFSKKKVIPAGSCGTVGISGLTLGGGYGFFSRKYGLTCDQVLDMEIVTADGKIIQASTDKDLFWALKGGGNGNFGVVTSITFQTQAMPTLFAAHTLKFRNLTAERYQQLLQTWFQCTSHFQEEHFAAFVLNGNTLTILATTFGNRANLQQSIQPLLDQADSKTFSDKDLPQAMKRYYGRTGPILFKNASAGLYQSYDDIAAIATQTFNLVQQYKKLIYQINTLGGAINNHQYEQASCYPHRSKPYLSELQAYWENKNQESNLLKGFQEIQQLILNQGITAQYRNYPDINFPNYGKAYYGNNYPQLQKIKSQYDPHHVFQYPQGIKSSIQ